MNKIYGAIPGWALAILVAVLGAGCGKEHSFTELLEQQGEAQAQTNLPPASCRVSNSSLFGTRSYHDPDAEDDEDCNGDGAGGGGNTPTGQKPKPPAPRDTDGDGRPDGSDTDDDGDGIRDRDDPDSDGDGVADIDECNQAGGRLRY